VNVKASKPPTCVAVQALRGIDPLLDQYAQDLRSAARSESLTLVDIFDVFERCGKVRGQAIDNILLAREEFRVIRRDDGNHLD
jgi:hypothetical protein